MPDLTRSKQDYLKALWALAPGGQAVATSRLAQQLEVSAPSVTNMLTRLAAEDLVAHAPRAGARLTPRGRRAALNIVRRHRILEAFLVRVLGFDWSEVHEDAEVLEHHVSDRVLEGRPARVVLPIAPDRRGRISIDVQGQVVYLVARSYRGGSFDVGTQVVVVEVDRGAALVASLEELNR